MKRMTLPACVLRRKPQEVCSVISVFRVGLISDERKDLVRLSTKHDDVTSAFSTQQ